MRIAVLFAFVAVTLLAACQRPSKELCEKGCWNYHELMYWHRAEAELAEAPEAEREALRARKAAELEQIRADADHPEHGLYQVCVETCGKSAFSEDRVECYAEAEDIEALRHCEAE